MLKFKESYDLLFYIDNSWSNKNDSFNFLFISYKIVFYLYLFQNTYV
jgi:hypothetical protein